METTITYDKETGKVKFTMQVTKTEEEEITVEELRSRIALFNNQIETAVGPLVAQRDKYQAMLDQALAVPEVAQADTAQEANQAKP